ncbi:MAG: hypothetical protein ACK5YX_07120, partial [Planctomyces sp.]
PLSLFDLQTDPGEQHNVAREHPEIVARLTGLADRMRRDLGDSLTGIQGTGVRPAGLAAEPYLACAELVEFQPILIARATLVAGDKSHENSMMDRCLPAYILPVPPPAGNHLRVVLPSPPALPADLPALLCQSCQRQ